MSLPVSSADRPQATVFISYAHESDALRKQVKALADWLSARECAVLTDHRHQYRPPAEGWQAWMLRCVREAATVLVVCTPKLKLRYEKNEETGHGASYEGAIVTQHIYDNAMRNTKFFPILPDDGSYKDIPDTLRPWWTNHRFPSGNEGILAMIRTGYAAVPTPRNPNTINIERLPYTRMDSIGREQDLTDLSESWNDPAVNVLSLVAAGGSGKSALVRTWLKNMEKQDYQGAVRIFGWSFESGKFNDPAASADGFIAEALAFFGESTVDSPKNAFDRESPWANGERLADHVRQERNLLILDGLETLQSDREAERGVIKDPALATLLTALAQENPGLCIITTRVPVADLAGSGQAISKDLEKLSPEAGRHILREAGVLGSEPELEKASGDFGGHALALTLLASWLKERYNRHDRHVHHAKDVPNRDKSVPEEKHHPYRVMQAWAGLLKGTPNLEVLYLIC